MDPRANRKESISLAKSIMKDYDQEKPIDEDDAARLAELVLELYEWIRIGGNPGL